MALQPETQQHVAVIDMARWHVQRYPELNLLFHAPNGGKRAPKEAALLNMMGVLPGVSDLILPVARRGYVGLIIEMKAPGEIRGTTPTQKTFLRHTWKEGHLSMVCDNATDAWAAIMWYLHGARHFDGPEAYTAVGVVLGASFA